MSALATMIQCRHRRYQLSQNLLPTITLAVLWLSDAIRMVSAFRECPMAELEGIRRDCFYDFEAQLSDTPSRSVHVLLQQKCNDSTIASYPVMRDCITSRVESHGCSNGDLVLNRYRLVRKAHEHLCSVRHSGAYCQELPKNLPHYVNLCIASLYDGIKRGVVCTRALMTVQKAQSCVGYLLQLMGSPCYYLQFNFYHVRAYIETQVDIKCNGSARIQGSASSMLHAVVAVASATLWRLALWRL